MNVCLLLAIALVARLCFPNPSVAQAIAVIPLIGLYAYSLYLTTKKKEPMNAQALADIQMLKDAVNAIKIGRSLGGR